MGSIYRKNLENSHNKKPIVTEWPEIEDATDEQLFDLLNHPQDLVRDHARRKLRNTTGVVEKIDLWLNNDLSNESILEGLRVLHHHGEVREKHLQTPKIIRPQNKSISNFVNSVPGR